MDKGGNVFVFGEIHGGQGNRDYMKGALTELHAKGVRNFAIELPEDAQEAFSSTLAPSGNEHAGGEGVIHARNGARLSGFGDYVALAAHARGLGMEVHCVDAPRDPKGREVERIGRMDRKVNQGQISSERYVQEIQGQFQRRNEHMAEKVSQLQGDTVLVTGMFHTGGKGSVEEKLRERGMSVVAVDLYPPGPNPTADLFERHETPAVDMKVKDLSTGPSTSDINSMISRLRGRGGPDGGEEVRIKPLSRGGPPSFEAANIRRAQAVER